MDITFNGLTNPQNIITVSDSPTILTVTNIGSGTKAKLTLSVANLNNLVRSTIYTITINDQIITGTFNIDDVMNKYFYLNITSLASEKVMIANTIVNALRNCPALDASYNIYQTFTTTYEPIVNVEAKEIGSKFNIIYSTNISSSALVPNNYAGTSNNELAQGNNPKIGIDIYTSDKDSSRLNTDLTLTDYITSLEKIYYKDSVSFDLSPVLTTMVEIDKTTPYHLLVYSKSGTNLTTIGTIKNNYVVDGYLVNQGGSYIPNFINVKLANNVSRGTSRDVYNNTYLYTYEPNIMFSLYANSNIASIPIIINYLNSSTAINNTETQTISINSNLTKININLNQLYFNNSSFIDLNINNNFTLRYDVIKPINALAENQRIYYTNSYGGTSFFDFTGERTEARKTTNTTYQKQLFDFYTAERRELNKIYNKNTDITVTLTSHLIKKDGTWQFYDMQNSKNVWTTINGVTYAILITDVQIDEQNVNDVYTATIKYTYSMGDTM